MSAAVRTTYAAAICSGFDHLLATHPEVFVIGQGLWSPWYVGASMTGLDAKFGRERLLDSPVAEAATTGAAIGASLCGYRPIVVHPRMDFMILAMDQIVNQAAKWRSMFGGQAGPAVTVRAIINRGGEQGAQHSQALHAWFAHVPGLRVLMPATPRDARDMLIAAALCDDPVVYIDDRWLYALEEDLPPVCDIDLQGMGPVVTRPGRDLTLVGSGYSSQLCLGAADKLAARGVAAEVIDLRVIAPLDIAPVLASVQRTGRLLVVDGGWSACGMAGEIIAAVAERLPLGAWRAAPRRLTLPSLPAPSSSVLEDIYYPEEPQIVDMAFGLLAVQSK